MADDAAKTQVWMYGVNDLREDPKADVLQAFKASGKFREDFVDLSQRCGFIPHVALVPPKIVQPEKIEKHRSKSVSQRGSTTSTSLAASEPERPSPQTDAVLTVQSMLLDRASMLVTKHLLPTSHHLEVIRFSSCRLDAELLSLLRAGLTEQSTVTTLQVDWNPVEVPLENTAAVEGEELDGMEDQRARKQVERSLRMLDEALKDSFDDVGIALEEAALLASKQPSRAVAMLRPLTADAFARGCSQKLLLSTEEALRIFDLLDSSPLGASDGLVSFDQLNTALNALPEVAPDAEASDAVAAAFAQFLNATSILELVSFRFCDIGRVEAQAMAGALRTGNQQLRALNLWGNRICDVGALAFGEALATTYGLQFLGLAKNRVTHNGLRGLCKHLGSTRLADKKEAEGLQKELAAAAKEREKKAKGAPAPKVDPKGRKRYVAEPHADVCEEHKDPETGEPYWLHIRNTELKILSLEGNPVTDAAVVLELQPFGFGDLVLKGVPCAKALMAWKASQEQPPTSEEAQADGDGGSSAEGAAAVETERPRGWRIIV
eukprot:gnl/TRDRNA2_/TRDRNA2_152241_c0_seq1.p1 gnl/TRDRNA2_/TRDRNA2_152241_c0~~gnl/TRDRNA2_/TRDRNA2_152241_c0_seq1.p1  ORF type:complete len:549 (-),score=125.90 gnl/TRDRNA2_/TRDRNA2_152241_c0_seq1:173-1819(-)